MGRLTKDPELRYTQSAEPMAIARYTLAVNKRFKRDGEPDADFIPCVVFGKGAEFAEKYFRKGMQVCVSGRIQVRSWEDDSGNKRWSTEIVLDEQYFADGKPDSASTTKQEPQASAPVSISTISAPVNDEDLPFS